MKTEFYKAKAAFRIPEIFREETNRVYPGQIEIPEKLVDKLMDLGDSEFVDEDICNPDLIIYDLADPINEIAKMEKKVNKVLEKWAKKKKLLAAD